MCFSMKGSWIDVEGQDYRACQNYGSLHKNNGHGGEAALPHVISVRGECL